ncbi:MAG: GDP-mannose 4,6-dehydratase [Pelagibacteraceae bacterium]|nr:GDP-mannose 4,6-dehydratase [Pelagibacteraceae bacterium]|tara:strand:- start:2605 stop:3582 length:978 start_codon:yes stop_codon:yes gene_type:complete
MSKKKILVLGSTGQDGSTICKYLVKKNFKVFGLVRKSSTGNLKNLKEIVNFPNFKILHGDLLDLISIEKIIREIRPHEIYNFADQDHVRWSFEVPSYSFDVTGASVVKILEIIKNHSSKSKFFQPLSSNIFGGSKSKKQNEQEKFSPLSIYALGKVSAFYACEMYKKVHNLKVYSAIFYNHESKVRPEEYVTRKITKSVARIFHGKQKKIVLGDIKAKIDWGYAEDYVEAAYNIMQLKTPDYFIIGSGKAHTVEYFLKKSFEYVGLNYKRYLKINKKLIRPVKNSTLVANTFKARRKFNFKNKRSLDTIISIMMENDLKLEASSQ